ncbi:uncharacterized protein LOC133504046 [Syngnathoides biaculeatus]|uniref:uncharacterized protein LOC133504046 n=1 Tax=Syngnathoides biaculeatus TaxID=300417 RepID=UPI002ADE4712|nr:uncharacterized protein LOC133504046 [Syngnathoides biaculeatus]
MGRILIGVISALACIILAESLTCNQCFFGVGGHCLTPTTEECSTNTSQCSTGKLTFGSISSLVGFNKQGCIEPLFCNTTTNDTLLGISYMFAVECCSTDRCNPIETSGAPSARMTLAVAVGAAVLASACGSLLIWRNHSMKATKNLDANFKSQHLGWCGGVFIPKAWRNLQSRILADVPPDVVNLLVALLVVIRLKVLRSPKPNHCSICPTCDYRRTMNNNWKTAIILATTIATASCLICRQCPVGIFNLCLFGSDVTCNNATQSCYRGNAQFNSSRGITLQIRGCLDSDLCGDVLTGNIFGNGYTASFECCNTNRCNGATSVQLSLTMAICAGVFLLWAV